jgi:hypothetical protein
MSWITVNDYEKDFDRERSRDYCEQLEKGGILFFDHIPFDLPAADKEFLLSARQENTRLHKNISYRPGQNIVRGVSSKDSENFQRLREIMKNYSARVVKFVDSFLQPYAKNRLLDYASYRPIEEAGRELPLHKRNELLHVDAFPSRPTHGGRILRVFTNINPTVSRVWEIGADFETVAKELAFDAGLEKFNAPTTAQKTIHRGAKLMNKIGLPVPDRSNYDRFMLRFHDYLKENTAYQKTGRKTRLEFPPNSTWLVYTDGVPHSVLSGQFALEQTFIIPFNALVSPKDSPAGVLEKMCEKSLIGK